MFKQYSPSNKQAVSMLTIYQTVWNKQNKPLSKEPLHFDSAAYLQTKMSHYDLHDFHSVVYRCIVLILHLIFWPTVDLVIGATPMTKAVLKRNNPYLWVFGACFDTDTQMCWCVSSREVYGLSFWLSGSVQDECFLCPCAVVFDWLQRQKCWPKLA